MMLMLLIILLIDNSRSLEWNCMETNQISEQCTITVEYISFQKIKYVCLTHTLTIKTLPPLSYSSNYTMKNFQINFCQLLTLNQLPFTLPSSVEKLDLRYNLLSTFILSFPLPFYLKSIYLDSNPNLHEINFGQKRVQENLINLSLRHNKNIQISSLPLNLIELDLTNCNLYQSKILILLKSLKKLTSLSLGENQLKQIPILNDRIQLEYLNLTNNSLTFIENKWLNKPMKILDLSFNQIKSLEFFKERLKIKQSIFNHTLQLSLSGNPLICDCWLDSVLKSPSINITDLSLLQCNSRSIKNLSSNNFLCSYSRHCASDCTCCDFEACDCHSICPTECLCLHDTLWTNHIIQCRKGNLSTIHIVLPETVTELNYEGNNIEDIKSFVFIGKIFLRKLNLAKNNLQILTNETFCGAINLHEINLSLNPNLMTILPNLNDLFGCLKNLQFIILSKDQIHEDEQISHGWTIESNKKFIRLIKIIPQTTVSFSNSTIFKSTTNIYPSTIISIYHQESYTNSNIIQQNQTLILIVFFLLFFILLFLLFLISLVIYRRKLRRHLAVELERQQTEHYYYHHHTNLHQSSIKIPESNTTSGVNDTLYEQLPSLSSDSEQPFLYNDKNTIAPALPPYPPTFRHYHCYQPHEYQYTLNDYSQHQCPTVLVLGNQLHCPIRHECLLSKKPLENLCHCNETYILSNVNR